MSKWSNCKSCGARIQWIQMASGKMMPCNEEPISYSMVHPCEVRGDLGEEVLTLVTEDGKIARGIFDPASDKVGYISHFATCPNANRHRKR